MVAIVGGNVEIVLVIVNVLFVCSGFALLYQRHKLEKQIAEEIERVDMPIVNEEEVRIAKEMARVFRLVRATFGWSLGDMAKAMRKGSTIRYTFQVIKALESGARWADAGDTHNLLRVSGLDMDDVHALTYPVNERDRAQVEALGDVMLKLLRKARC